MAEIINNLMSIADVGNTSSAATNLTAISNTITGTLSSSDLYDWYKFTPTNFGTLGISLNGLTADADIRLYNSSSLNSALASSTNSGTASDSISAYVVGGQTYYLSVYNYSKTTMGYSLAVNLPTLNGASTVSTAPTVSDDFTANTGTTGRVTAGSSVRGSIETANDRDWFKINLAAGQKIQVDLKGSPTGSGTLSDPYIGGIYNSNGVLQANSSNDDFGGGRNSKVTFTATTADSYYVEAKAYSNYTGTYELKVESLGGVGPIAITQSPTSNTTGIIQGYNTDYSHGRDGKVIPDDKAKWAIDFDTDNESGISAYSVYSGTVAHVQTSTPTRGYGNYVTVKHEDSTGNVFYATYAHLESVAVTNGQSVSAGTTLGEVGNSGLGYTEAKDEYKNAHLHLQFGSRLPGTVADGSTDTRSPVYFQSFIATNGSDGIWSSSNSLFLGTDIVGTSTSNGWTHDRLFGTNNGERIFGLSFRYPVPFCSYFFKTAGD